MFGLFQSDLPIGKRLWLLLLAVVLIGSLPSTPFAKFDKPVDFVIDILLVYGFGSFIENILSGIIIMIFTGRYVYKQMTYPIDENQLIKRAKLQGHWTNKIPLILSPYIFLAAMCFTAYFTSNVWVRRLGYIGLCFYLIEEMTTSAKSIVDKDQFEYLSLYSLDEQTMRVKFANSKNNDLFIHKGDWMKTLAFLEDNQWELVEHSMGELSQDLLEESGNRALLKRKRSLNFITQLADKGNDFVREKELKKWQVNKELEKP